MRVLETVGLFIVLSIVFTVIMACTYGLYSLLYLLVLRYGVLKPIILIAMLTAAAVVAFTLIAGQIGKYRKDEGTRR
jgi:hypothetical protein